MMRFMMVLLVVSNSSASLLLLFGAKTPAKIKEHFSAFPSLEINSNQEFSYESSPEPPSLLFDVTFDLSLFPAIDYLSSKLQIPYVSFSRPFESELSKNRFFAFPSISSEAEALKKMIKYLNWKDFTVFVSNSIENIGILDEIRKSFSRHQVKTCIYDSQISESKLDTLVKRFLIITGNHNLLVLDQDKSLELLLNVLIKRKVGKYGRYLLFGPTSITLTKIDGAVSLAYSIGNKTLTENDLYLEVLKKLIQLLEYADQNELRERCPGQVCFSELQVINYRNKEDKVVGKIGSSVEINSEIIFPGNNSQLNSGYLKTKIPIMIANGTREPNDIGNSEAISRFYYGASYAVETANAELTEENFEYELIPTDCGNRILNLTWSIRCLSNFLKSNSIAYITGYTPMSAMVNLIAFKTFNQFLPQVSPDGLGDFLNNKTEYPEFIKLSGRYYEFGQNSIFMYLFYNWRNIIVLALKSDVMMKFFEDSFILLQKMGIKVVNPEEYRYFPENYTRGDFEKFKHIFQFVKDSGCRIVTMIGADNGAIYEGLYDIGLRKGDVLIVAYLDIYYSLAENIEKPYLDKRKEICQGALVANHIQYEGRLGKKIEEIFRNKYGTVLNKCLTYDAFQLIRNSVNYIINKGEDYEDHQLLMNVMRNQRFVGCSGEVYFLQGQNSRDKAWLGFSQVIFNPDSNQIDLLQVSALNKFSIIVAREINEPIWPTGEKSIPSNFRPIQICVYKQKPQISKNGKMSLHLISLVLLLVVLITSILSFKRFNCTVPPFIENVNQTYNDFIQQLFPIAELFQILSLEPSEGLFTTSTKGMNIKLGFDLISTFDFKFNDFWSFYSLLLVLSGIWSLLATLSVFINKEIYRKYEYLSFFKLLSESVIPVVGQFLFIPASLMLLSIFKCEEGVSDELFESFLHRDCSQYCYRGRHKLVAVVSVFVIALLFIVLSYFRPYWDINQNSQHIKIKISYISISTVFQVILVVIRVNLENSNKIVQGFLLSGTLAVFAIITTKMKPYNYEKMNVFKVTLICLCSWNMFIASLYNIFAFERQFTITLFSGIAFILGLGYKRASQFPSKFNNDHMLAVPTLIKFQFSRKAFNTSEHNSFYRNLEIKVSPAKAKD